jgi:hypothetical protein
VGNRARSTDCGSSSAAAACRSIRSRLSSPRSSATAAWWHDLAATSARRPAPGRVRLPGGGIHRTVHGRNRPGPQALDLLHAQRLGHAVALQHDPGLYVRVKSEGT